ncbi:hypothetical protein IAI18_09770 [Acetobacteraceae bacterium H6797]|nr:hypothetical protein [Acetobacteraceae bacterium H6797]
MTARRALIALAASAGLAGQAYALTPPQENPAQRPWVGQYAYEWPGGRNAGGIAIFVDYKLTVGTGVTDCRIDITGYQSDEHIRCEVAADATHLWIRFHSYTNGKLVNQYGTAVYRPGQELLRLTRSGNGPLLTEWGALQPSEKDTGAAPRFSKQ